MSQATVNLAYFGAGAILVAVGGLVTTFGWERIRSQRQSRNVAIGVARELALNDALIRRAEALATRWPTRSAEDSFPYEPFHNDHVLGLVTSGTLDADGDREILEVLENYQREVARFNGLLRIVGRTNPGLFIKTDFISVTDPGAWPTTPADTYAESFVKLLAAHQRAVKSLEAKYPWATQKGQLRRAG